MRHVPSAIAARRFLFGLFLLFCTQCHVCAKECDNDGRDVTFEGSFPAESCRFEYLVSIKHPTFNTHLCSGTLIKDKYVLTAASCLDGVPDAKAHINGYYRDGDFGEVLTISEVTSHPDYTTANSPFDIAIAKLSGSAASHPKIKIANKNESPSKGTTVAVVGWGRTSPQGPLSDVMQARKDYKVSPSKCNDLDPPSGFLCVGKNNANICEGDLGGPLLDLGNNENGDVQVGVISGAVGDCSTNRQPGMFVDVAAVSNWIRMNT